MKKVISCIISVVFFSIFFVSDLYAVNLQKPFRDPPEVIRATYTSVGFTLYSDEKGKVGLVVISCGRSVLVDWDGLKLFSVKHVWRESDKKYDIFTKVGEKYFLTSGPEESQIFIEKVMLYFRDNQLHPYPGVDEKFKYFVGAGDFIQYMMFTSVFHKCWKNNDFSAFATELDMSGIVDGESEDSAYIKLDDSLKSKLNYLDKDDFDLNFDWSSTGDVGLLGAPGNISVWYREGNILEKDWVTEEGGRDINSALINVDTFHGDSGGILVFLDTGKVIGVVTKFNTESQNGVVLKIEAFLRSLKLLDK